MEKHFLNGLVADQGEPTFRPEPWYNPHGDCLVFQMADEAVVADRIDELLTIYNSAIDRRPIGFQIKGVKAIVRKFGLDGLIIESLADHEAVRSVSITALLLAAYEEGPRTINRRQAYATAMDCPGGGRIAADELQPV